MIKFKCPNLNCGRSLTIYHYEWSKIVCIHCKEEIVNSYYKAVEQTALEVSDFNVELKEKTFVCLHTKKEFWYTEFFEASSSDDWFIKPMKINKIKMNKILYI